ncbi:MAG: hypothetical protein JW806_07370 [Sedimentisphaerales bacterium]|nr:hypothetical protein [Sedimentisphaerales bacterium]
MTVTCIPSFALCNIADDKDIVNNSNNNWRILPIRTKYEFLHGLIGGEGTQLPHSITRSPSDPNYIYWAHDGGGPWKSTDAGETWTRPIGKGLYHVNSDSIKVDPTDPCRVFIVATHLWYPQNKKFSGLYLSTDAGTNWKLVLQTDWSFNWNKHRYIKDLIAYDPATKESTKTKDWYLVFPENKSYTTKGLFRSVDYGNTWNKIADTSIDKFYQIAVGIGGKVYLGSDDGLFLYTRDSTSMEPLGNLPKGDVTSVFIHPSDPNMIFVTVYNTGCYKSINGGKIFTELKKIPVWAGFYNPGYPDTIYLCGIQKNNSTIVTHNGGKNWSTNKDCYDIPEGKYKTRIHGKQSGIVPNTKKPNEAIAFANANIYKTTNGGKTFTESATLFTGYSLVYPTSIAFDQFNPKRFALGLADVGYVVTTNAGKWFYKNYTTCSGDNIDKWKKNGSIPSLPTYCSCIDFKPEAGSETMAASIGYVTTNKPNSRHMYLKDENTGWALETNYKPNNPQPPYPWILFLQYHRTDPNTVYSSRWKSTDGGISYQPIDFSPFIYHNSALNTYDIPMIQGQCMSHPDIVYATCLYNQVIIRSADKGETWTEVTKPGWKFNTLSVIPAFAIDPTDVDILYSIDANKDIARYNATANRWTSLGLLPQVHKPDDMFVYVRYIAIDPRHKNIIYASLGNTGISNIWRSIDAGKTWQDISKNLPRIGLIIGVSPHTGELLAGGLCGTYVLPPPYESNNLIYNNATIRHHE